MLRAKWLAPMDRPPIRNGAAVFSGAVISAVGDAETLRAAHPDATEHDLGDAVLLPGLINAHVHLELSDTPRPADRWDAPLADWLIEVIKSAPADGDVERVGRALGIGVEQCL